MEKKNKVGFPKGRKRNPLEQLGKKRGSYIQK